MKIYTKSGDKGETGLLGGKRTSKSSERIHTYGEVDELNSFIGLLISKSKLKKQNELMTKVQVTLFDLGSLLACDTDDWDKYKLKKIPASLVLELEKNIDEMTLQLPALKNFILPGGEEASSLAHVTRTIARRVERQLIKYSLDSGVDVENSLELLNRLSDYFFTFARFVNFSEGKDDIVVN